MPVLRKAVSAPVCLSTRVRAAPGSSTTRARTWPAPENSKVSGASTTPVTRSATPPAAWISEAALALVPETRYCRACAALAASVTEAPRAVSAGGR